MINKGVIRVFSVDEDEAIKRNTQYISLYSMNNNKVLS